MVGLPEVAITVSVAARGDLALAAGNLIGGIALQTMMLVVCDFAVRSERPLSYLVGALTPVLEGLLVVPVVSGVSSVRPRSRSSSCGSSAFM